jgi:hypothetical protein
MVESIKLINKGSSFEVFRIISLSVWAFSCSSKIFEDSFVFPDNKTIIVYGRNEAFRVDFEVFSAFGFALEDGNMLLFVRDFSELKESDDCS